MLRTLISCFAATVLTVASGPVVAQPAGDLPDEFQGAGIEERLGEMVSLDLPFVASDGTPVTLGDYVDGERPVVVAFVYHNCPMLCSLILDGMTEALRESSVDLGEDYEALAISFDEADTPERAAAVRERYAALAGEGAADGLHFLVGEPPSIEQVTSQLGFGFKWNERQKEFAHSAGLFFLSPEGRLTRVLYGIEFPPSDFRSAVLEAGEGRVGSPVEQLLLYCFVYDPDAGSYVLHAQNAMKVGGVLTIIVLGSFLFFFWRRESRKRPVFEETATGP
ncbi:MAG: SCO family protein [Bacteroidota bacterium]